MPGLWDAANAAHRVKSIVANVYIKRSKNKTQASQGRMMCYSARAAVTTTTENQKTMYFFLTVWSPDVED